MKATDYLRASGYVQLTENYFLPEEQDIFDNAVEQLRKGGRTYMVLEEDEMATIFIRIPTSNILSSTTLIKPISQ